MSAVSQPPGSTSQNNPTIDNIVATQPELGPTPPDGGYGWIVLICAVIVQITVPSITIAYGILILYTSLQVEYEENQVFKLWGNNAALVPILTTIFSLFSTSWSRQIISISNRPRLVSICGIFFVTAGILISSMGLDANDDAVIFNIFAGLLAGVGTSLVIQQSEVLLKQYFNRKYHIVQMIYKLSISIGSVLISLIMGGLLIQFGERYGLVFYSLIIFQNCLILFGFTRPTYITATIQRSYKELKDGSEDEDEIYSSPSSSNKRTDNSETIGQDTIIPDDDNDEDIISTFNSENITREVIQPSPAAISRLESLRKDIGRSRNFERTFDIEQPDSLYRETTVTNGVINDNTFTFESSTNAGTIRRTADVKKNAVILISAIKDWRFYVYTYVGFCTKFTMLMMGLLFPQYISQQIIDMELWTITGLLIVAYMGAICLNIVIGFLPRNLNRQFYLALFSSCTFFGLLGLSISHSKTWLLITGMWTIFSMTALYMMEQPICDNMRMEKEVIVVSMVSNCIIAVVIAVVSMAHNYEYHTIFKFTAILHMVSPILLAIIRKM